MSYETNLTLPVNLGALLNSVVSPRAGYDVSLFTDATSTLGNKTGDFYVSVNVNSSVSSNGTSLSAAAGSVTISLSSASVLPTPVVIPAYIAASTFTAATSSATVTIKSTEPSFLNTSISLSANRTTTVIDTTKESVIDNIFYINDARRPVTTFGHARLVSYLG
jgi:hypothetical protein